MKKAALVTLLYFALCSFLAAQPWVYDFGTGTGSFTTGNSNSTTFLPIPPTGTAQIWIRDTGTYRGGFYLTNPGLSTLGLNTELRIQAPSTSNLNKFSLYNSIQGKSAFIQFDVLMGSSTGGYAASGEFNFQLGTGSYFSNSSGYYKGYVFSGIRWVLAANGAITTTYYNGDTSSPLGSNPFSQSNVYRVEIYANNKTTTDTYSRQGIEYHVAPNKQDIWVNGILIGDELDKARLADDSTIDSFMFYGLSSTSSEGNLFLDNIVYSNSLPAFPATQASNVTISNVLDNQITVNWTPGNGSKRVVIVSTTEDIIDPEDGTDPAANPIFSSRGQQVVFNGTGDSVTITNLTPDTNYWIKVYEVSGDGLGTRYNTSTQSGNYTDVFSETLPVELSAFTAQVNSLGKVQLQWITQSETNAFGFYVLRGMDNCPGTAEIVSPFISATNTSTMQLYQFTDEAVWEAGTYYYWLQSLDLDGASILHGPVICNFNPGGQFHNPSIPLQSGFRSIYPNPFNPCTTIAYEINEPGNPQILIYNLKGQRVRTFAASHSQAGDYHLTWDGLSDKGEACASGVYSIVLVKNGKCHVRKAVLMK